MEQKYVVGEFDKDRNAWPTFAVCDFESSGVPVKKGYQGPFIDEEALKCMALNQEDVAWGNPDTTIRGKSKISGDIFLKSSTIENSELIGEGHVTGTNIENSIVVLPENEPEFCCLSGTWVIDSELYTAYNIYDSTFIEVDADFDEDMESYICNAYFDNCELSGQIIVTDCECIENSRIKDSIVKNSPWLRNTELEYVQLENVVNRKDEPLIIHGTDRWHQKNITGPLWEERLIKAKADSRKENLEMKPVNVLKDRKSIDNLLKSTIGPDSGVDHNTDITSKLLAQLDNIKLGQKRNNEQIESNEINEKENDLNLE